MAELKSINTVAQFNCGGCGSTLSVVNRRAKHVACQYCGSVADARSDAHKVIMKLPDPKRFKPFSFMKVGMMAVVDGMKYQVIARTRWRQTYVERWVEDGETGYSNEIWEYDTYTLLSEYFTYLYISEDKEGFFSGEEYLPDKPRIPNNHLEFVSLTKGKSTEPIQEMGTAKVIYFEGETNYNIAVGDKIKFFSYKKGRNSFVTESRLNKKGEVKEIEFFKEKKMKVNEVLEYFKGDPGIYDILQKRRMFQFLGALCGITFAVFLISMIFSFIKPESAIFLDNTTLSTVADSSYLTPFFELPEAGLYRVELKGNQAQDNTWFYQMAYLIDNNGDVVNSVEGEFYRYSGYDSDGYWSEAKLENSKIVKLKEPGTFRAQIFIKRDLINSGSVNIGIAIKKGVMLSRYFVIGTILFLFSMIVFLAKGKQYK